MSNKFCISLYFHRLYNLYTDEDKARLSGQLISARCTNNASYTFLSSILVLLYFAIVRDCLRILVTSAFLEASGGH